MGYISGVSQVDLGYILRHVSGMSQVYQGFLKYFLRISRQYIGHSQACIRLISSISQTNLRNISGMCHAFLSHIGQR